MTLTEHRTDSPCLVVFLHGLGLDGGDYAEYMATHEQHSVAVTLPGFDAAPRIAPVTLPRHVEVLSASLLDLQRQYPDKPLILTGFSLGADMILRLADAWRGGRHPAPRLAGALLVDPNVNHSTMTVSRLFAGADPADPLPELLRVIALSTDVTEFRELCRYLAKVTTKDFAQVRQHARDFVGYWEPTGYRLIAQRLRVLAGYASRVRVTCSGSYREHVAALGEQLGSLVNVSFSVSDVGHFELLQESRLHADLAQLTASAATERAVGECAVSGSRPARHASPVGIDRAGAERP